MPVLAAIEQTDVLEVNNVGSCLTFKIGGQDWILPQFSMVSGTLPATPTITATLSIDGTNYYAFPDGAKDYTTLGLKVLLTVTGTEYVKYAVTVEAGTGGELVRLALSVGTMTTKKALGTLS